MKKYLISIALIVAVLCSLCVFSVSAVEQENIHISSTEFQVRQGDEFTTTIYIADNANIIDFEVLLKYDTDKLTLVSATENEDIKGAVVVNAENAGSIGINYSKTSDNVTKKTLLVDLTFRVDEYLPAGIYDCLTVDETGPYIAHRLANGLLEEVDFNCEFAPLFIYEIGDVDLNNKVDIGDATYIRRHLAKLHTLTEFQLLFANTQNDDVVDIADAVALQRKLAKLEVDGYGDRVNVLFCNTNGDVLTKKSVKIGAGLNNLPEVPYLSGYTNGRWSLSKVEYIAPNYTNLTSELTVYAIYEKSISSYMQYYMSQVNNQVNQYNGVISSDWNLPTEIVYAGNTAYTGKIVWKSSDANVFSNSGVFNKQTYDKSITLTAEIYSYLNSTTPESSETLTFTLLAKGAYSTPTKAEIVQYLQTITNGTVSGTSTITGGEINCDLNLIRKISNDQVGNSSGSVYEVRIEWVINNNGVYEPISQIQRGTSAKTIDLVATITFNGEPLEDDGKVYFDDVSLPAITEDEIRRYVISQIASKVQNSFSNGDALWTDETIYGCDIKWISNDINTVTIEQNTVTVNEQAIHGTTCPITVQVTYPTDTGSNTFNLEYIITVENPSNTLLRPGVNISDSLYYALMNEMRDRFGYTQLTTEALKNTKFVSLDLSKYNDWFEDGAGELHAPITDLTGLTYCENLRLLDISGLNITNGVSEIAGLAYLESFVANNVGISSDAVGGAPILSSMINLKLVDLSNNNLTSLEMFFSSSNIYSKLKELYLDNNDLSDISLLSQAPMLTTLTLSNNSIESNDISVLSDKVYLTYLSLNNNNISDISSLQKLTALTELRLHCNSISNIAPLKNMTSLTKLYLGENKIANVDALEALNFLEVLYLNSNENIADISALFNLSAMQVLNISDCSVNQIVDLQNMTGLKELYAENNDITGFSVLCRFTAMEKLLLAGNERSGQVLEWNMYIGGMANLKVLTLSGLDVSDLSFLETTVTDASTQATTTSVKPIERLEIADCSISSNYSNDDVSVDNMEMLKKLELTLKYLDISDNPIDANITKLGYLSSLELLYADNINIGNDIVGLMASSQSLKYLSLENCNISGMYNNVNKPWLSTSRKYVFIDLAQNPISAFDLSFVDSSASTLKYLYLDTSAITAVFGANTKFEGNVLENLSLEGYSFNSIQTLPNMEQLSVLNISKTGISDLFGKKEGEDYPSSISRFAHLDYIDISGNGGVFTQANLNILYETFASSEADVYLYEDHTLAGFDITREINYINTLALANEEWKPDGGNIVDYRNNNDNGLSHSSKFNGFEFVWTVDNAYVKISDNVLSVTNIAIPSDEYEIVLTGHTSLYGQDCEVTAPVIFYKEKYKIKYVLDSSANAYSKRTAVNDSRNVSTYAVEGKDIAVYDPERGDYDYFLGWYEDANYTIPFKNDLKTNPRNVVLYAKWDVATYYDSIDETPWETPAGRVVIDWRNEIVTDLLKHTNRSVEANCYNKLNVLNQTSEIVFIGDPNKTYTNFMMHICGFAEGQKLVIRFVDFNFVTNENAAIDLYEDSGVDLTIEVVGSCSIGSTYAGGSIIGSADAAIKNLTFTDSGTMSVIAGDGATVTAAGMSGNDGGVAVYAKNIVFDMDSHAKLHIYGGNGSDGVRGADGAKAGADGVDGGNGGNGGAAIVGEVNVNAGNVELYGGNGGNGGDGGDGKTGTTGKTEVNIITGGKDGDKNYGGKGGNGGSGGDGGASSLAIIGTLNDTNNYAIVINGTYGDGGNGGNGGNGGKGGNYYNAVGSVWRCGGGSGGDGGNGGDGKTAGLGGTAGAKGGSGTENSVSGLGIGINYGYVFYDNDNNAEKGEPGEDGTVIVMPL